MSTISESDELFRRAGELERQAQQLQSKAHQLRAQGELARRREHRERLDADPLYREEIQHSADSRRAEALERLEHALEPVYDVERYPSTRRVVSKDRIRSMRNGETVQVARREYTDQLYLDHIGPRGGHHGGFELGDGDAEPLAELIEDFIRRYPGACTAERPELQLTAEVPSGHTWEISIMRSSMGNHVFLGWQRYQAIEMWVGALRPLVALLRDAR